MKNLGPPARKIVDRAKAAERLDTESRARLRAKVMARVGTAALVGATTAAVAKSTTAAVALPTTAGATATGAGAGAAGMATAPSLVGGGLSFVTKIGLSAVLLGGVATTTVVVTRQSSNATNRTTATTTTSTTATTTTSTTTTSTTTTSTTTSTSMTTSTTTTTSEPTATAQPNAVPTSTPAPGGGTQASAPHPAPVPEIDQLKEETAILARAQAALSGGRAADALKELDLHATKYPKGKLGPERQAFRAIALCTLGRMDEGRAEAARYRSWAGDSPVAARVTRSCGE